LAAPCRCYYGPTNENGDKCSQLHSSTEHVSVKVTQLENAAEVIVKDFLPTILKGNFSGV
jgi:hypothetical protein